ncbi:nickel-binding protein [Dongia deserti]|uniref:nickel-binding protein n=1 Tax=Dongia deserti TaxID=2268030 RepID=UPI000E6548A6|nr:nickel-binding protein [Dongia deserti]
MPIFMDRHDVWETTAADVAEAHRRDLEVQDRYGVRFLTYWFDQQRGTIFCLVDAPDKGSAQRVHREAHGHVAGEIVEVSLSAVEAFLGRITDPSPASSGHAASAMDAGHRAILFTDIVGSTEMTARLGDRLATELIRAHDSIVRRCLAACDGREVKHTGDGIMASFPDSARGVDCAIRIQREFQRHNTSNPEPIHIRIGLDSGEPVEDSNDLFGKTVQLAARLCSEAAADQILVSETICREHGDAALFKAAEQRQLKGFAAPVGVVECVWTETSAITPST